jgi:hypothetical protein
VHLQQYIFSQVSCQPLLWRLARENLEHYLLQSSAHMLSVISGTKIFILSFASVGQIIPYLNLHPPPGAWWEIGGSNGSQSPLSDGPNSLWVMLARSSIGSHLVIFVFGLTGTEIMVSKCYCEFFWQSCEHNFCAQIENPLEQCLLSDHMSNNLMEICRAITTEIM